VTTTGRRRRCERDAPDHDHADPDPGGAERTAAARGPPSAAAPAAAAAHPRTPPEVIATAKAQRWEPVEVLKALFTHEAAGRERSALATRRAAAGFPTGKTFEAWTPAASSSIPAPTQQALRTLEWVHRRENLVVRGPSGTGKTFLLEALGQHAVEHGLKVAWFTLEDLGILLRRHRADDTVTKAITRVLRADLIVVDDIGLLPGGRRRRRGPVPTGRCRLRETLRRALLQPPSHRAELVAITGQALRPPPGRSHGP